MLNGGDKGNQMALLGDTKSGLLIQGGAQWRVALNTGLTVYACHQLLITKTVCMRATLQNVNIKESCEHCGGWENTNTNMYFGPTKKLYSLILDERQYLTPD